MMLRRALFVLSYLMFIVAWFLSAFVAAYVLFAPTQYLSLDRADVPDEILGSVKENRVPEPDYTHQTQYLHVPANSQLWFRTVSSRLPEVLEFGITQPKNGSIINYKIELNAGVTLFDSQNSSSLPPGGRYGVPLPGGGRNLTLKLSTSSPNLNVQGAWINLRIRTRPYPAWIGLACVAGALAAGIALARWRNRIAADGQSVTGNR